MKELSFYGLFLFHQKTLRQQIMKRRLLFGLALGCVISVQAQQTNVPGSEKIVPLSNPAMNKAYPKPKNLLAETPTPYALQNPTVSVGGQMRANSFGRVQLGTTYYDLQTNSAICNRVVRNADGTIGATWTISQTPDHPGFADRGTGYNYYNGTAWGLEPTSRIESKRTGWPNIVHLANGSELVVSHNTTVSQLEIAKRTVKGTGTWTEDETSLVSPISGGNWWPRMASGGPDGNTVHVISITYPVASGGTVYEGLDGALTYSRSLDGGTTWDIPVHKIFADFDSTETLGVSADAYAIDCRGSVVAVVAGDGIQDMVLLKSTDNGVTWTKTTILDFPLDKWDYETTISDVNADGVADTIDTYDGNFALIIDNNDQVHVFYGNNRIIQDNPVAGQGYSYFPGTDGLFHWTEAMGTGNAVIIASALDRDGDGVLNVPTPTVTGQLAWGNYGTGITSFPNVGISADGKLYLTYASIFENTDNGSQKAYRHTYIMASRDGGATWSDPVDLVPSDEDPDFTEAIYAAVAKRVDAQVHVVHMEDTQPGQSLAGNPAGSEDPENVNLLNNIIYTPVDTSLALGVNPTVLGKEGFNVYPNPTKDQLLVSVNAGANQVSSFEIINIDGKVVMRDETRFNGALQAKRVDVSSLAKGVYMVRMNTESGVQTQKFIKQ